MKFVRQRKQRFTQKSKFTYFNSGLACLGRKNKAFCSYYVPYITFLEHIIGCITHLFLCNIQLNISRLITQSDKGHFTHATKQKNASCDRNILFSVFFGLEQLMLF